MDDIGRGAIEVVGGAEVGEEEVVVVVVVDKEVGERTEDDTTGTNVMEVLRLGMVGCEEDHG